MADNIDDDDSFGEFTFAPIQATLNPPSQIPTTDDVWGDFNSFQNTTTIQNPNPPFPSQTQAQAKWEKISGALPLSFFGDEEEHENEDHDEKLVDDVKSSNYNNSYKRDVKLGINDLLADLYGSRQQQQEGVQVENNSNGLDFSALSTTVSKDPVSTLDPLSSFGVNTVAVDAEDQGSDNDDDDEGGWEFIDAFTDSKVARNEKDHKELSEKSVSSSGLQRGSHGPVDLFAATNNGLSVESHVKGSGSDSKPDTDFQNGFSADLKVDSEGAANELSSNPLGESDDFVDTFGEFETAFMKPSPVKKEIYEERFGPMGSDKSHGSVDLFSFANGAPSGSHMEKNRDERFGPLGSHDKSHESVDLFSFSNGAPSGSHMEKNRDERFDPLGSLDESQGSVDLFSYSNGAPSGSHMEKNREERFDPLGSLDKSHGSVDLFSFSNGAPSGSHMETNRDERLDPLGSLDKTHSSVDVFSHSNGAPNGSHMEKNREERFDPLGSLDKSHGSVDLFSYSNGAPSGSHVENNVFDLSQTPVVENGFASDISSQTECKETKYDSDSKPPDVSADDESSGNIETTCQESGSKLEGFEASKKNYKEPVPLSIFGIEEDLEADNSLNLEHDLFKPSTHGTHTRNLSSNLSINDILSDLYSQAQPISSDGKENLLHSTVKEYGSHVADSNDNDDNDFNDGSWEFKDASSQSRVGNQNLSFKEKLNDCVNLYSDLKNDLCVVARQHLHSLKKAQSTATLAGEELKVASLDKQIQVVLEKIHQTDVPEEMLLDHSENIIFLEKYTKTFQEPEFQLLDSEYHISRRLLSAESDLPTAVDLINHFTRVLKILTLAPTCEPADYVSLWFKVISVCFQELKHGTWIWKQALEKNVHSQILSEKQGRQFIIAIGEIYRVVMMLEAAVKFYKPWILLSGANLEGIYGLLEECHSLWSTSGLEESIPADYLLYSIRRIQNLDEIAIADQILSQENSQCGLSLLSPGVVPEMKLVTWHEDKYFVTLANLYANLISPDPPKLSIHVG